MKTKYVIIQTIILWSLNLILNIVAMFFVPNFVSIVFMVWSVYGIIDNSFSLYQWIHTDHILDL